MGTDGRLLAEIAFAAEVIQWRGPAPFYFAVVPPEQVGEVHYAAREASYGWGCVPVNATIGGVDFTTSLFPRDGGYMLPLKVAVRSRCGIAPGDIVQIRLRIFA